MKLSYIFILVVLIIGCTSKSENLAQSDLQTRDVATNLKTVWTLAWGPDNNLWMTERYGRISRVNPETGEVMPLVTISDVFETGEGGLTGLALHPEFDNNPFVYVAYNYHAGSGTAVKIVRFKYDGTTLVAPMTMIEGISGNVIHDGCRLLIDKDKLYITTGDAGTGENAQDLNSPNGKILRINLDGSIPSDNPIPNSPLWTWGHRNPQGLAMANGILYSSEHGPDTDDELNIIQKGRNYGWPNVRGFCDTEAEKKFCKDSNVAEPIAAWTPTLAVCGLAYYDNDRIPQWKNSLLLNTLKASEFLQIKLTDDHLKVASQQVYFQNTYGRLRAICVSPDGRIFIGTSNRDGRGNPTSVDDRIIEIKGAPNSTQEKLDNSLNFMGYPNPSDGIIDFMTGSTIAGVLNIYDMWGNMVKTIEIGTGVNLNGLIRFDGLNSSNEKCAPGLYLAVLRNELSVYRYTFIIK